MDAKTDAGNSVHRTNSIRSAALDLAFDMQSTEWTQYNKDRVVTDDSDGVYPVYQLGWFP